METLRSSSPRRAGIGILGAVASILATGANGIQQEFTAPVRVNYRHGKHNGRHAGAFGGKHAAKAHRRLYVKEFGQH